MDSRYLAQFTSSPLVPAAHTKNAAVHFPALFIDVRVKLADPLERDLLAAAGEVSQAVEDVAGELLGTLAHAGNLPMWKA